MLCFALTGQGGIIWGSGREPLEAHPPGQHHQQTGTALPPMQTAALLAAFCSTRQAHDGLLCCLQNMHVGKYVCMHKPVMYALCVRHKIA